MWHRKKFRLFLIITTMWTITLFKTIDSIRVPTDWSEISTANYPQQKLKLSKEKYVYSHPKYQYSGQQSAYKSQKPHGRHVRIPQRITYSPIIYKTINLKPVKQNLYIPKTMHEIHSSSSGQQPNQAWMPLTTVNQKYNLAPILTNDQSSNPKQQPFIWVPYQKTESTDFNTPIASVHNTVKLPTAQTGPLKEKQVKEYKRESITTIKPSLRIPDFAEKIHANDPFSRKYVQKDGLESRSDEQSVEEENPENYKIPQDETPISEHENPLDIPTKPIYPGEGEWAKPDHKYRVFNRPEIQSKLHDSSDYERPDGYEVFENGQERFRNALTKYTDKQKELSRKYSNNEGENEADTLYERPEIGFVPLKTYAQVRKTETTRHLPQSEAYKEASNEEELINAPRLREVIKNTRAHTVYTEEGYEDEAYDHGGKEKNAEENDGYLNLEDDFEDYKKRQKKRKKSKYNDYGHNVKGVDNESHLNHEDVVDKNEDKEFDEKYSNVNGDVYSSGTEVKNTKLNPKIAKSETSKSTVNSDSKDMKKLRKKKSKIISQMSNDLSKVEIIDNLTTTLKPFFKSQNVNSTEISNKNDFLKYDNKVFDNVDPKVEENLSTNNTSNATNKSKVKKKIKKLAISKTDKPILPNLTRVKRYDREKLSKIYIRKRPKYYWERSKNRGDMKIEFNQSSEKPHPRNNTKGVNELMPVIKPISKLAYKNRPKRDLATEQFEIDNPKLNLDELSYRFVDVSKIQLPKPKSDLTYIKYPYYLLAESGRINKHSPLKYAEDMRNIPRKSEGGMEFYESKADIQCPEIESTVEPVPERIENQEIDENYNQDESENSNKFVKPVTQIQRLKGLGDKIDCMKMKHFGENPLDSPFFKDEIIEPPSMELVFQENEKIFSKHLRTASSNINGKKKSLLKSNELLNNTRTENLNYNKNDSNKKLQKRDTTLINTDLPFKLDTIVVLEEEHSSGHDDASKIVFITKNETNFSENITDIQSNPEKNKTIDKNHIPQISHLDSITHGNETEINTTTNPSTTTTESITTQKMISKRRRRPFVSTIPPTQQPHYSEDQSEDFLIIIDTGGESFADIPLQLPLVNNKEFAKTFDINKYLPHTEIKTPILPAKKPNNVQMEVFADILQHMKTITHKPQTTSERTNLDTSTNETILSKDVQKATPVKRKIQKPNRKIRMKVTNNSLTSKENSFNKTSEHISNDQPASETENHSIYNHQPSSVTENYSEDAVNDLNIASSKLKYPGTYKTLYFQDNQDTIRDVFNPDTYNDMPEYSSNPDHPQANYDFPPSIRDEFNQNENPSAELHSSKYLVHEFNKEIPFQYDLIFNRIQKSYLLRPVKQNQYNSDVYPNPNYTPEHKPLLQNHEEEILLKGLKPVQYQNGLKLIIPQSKATKQFVEEFQPLTIRTIRGYKPSKVIRVFVHPKKVLRITTKQPLRVTTPQQVPIPIPISIPHRFNYHKYNTQQIDYYNIRGMVPPLITEHGIDYSSYQPVVFSKHDLPVDSLANENTNYLTKKSFVDLQTEYSNRMETIVDMNGNPVTSFQRKYTEINQFNRPANNYKKEEENIDLMKGEVLLAGNDSYISSSSNMESNVNLTEDKNVENLKDSYGNIIDKSILNGYSSVIVEMANESKKYINESHEPNMTFESKIEVLNKTSQENIGTTTNVSIDSRRGEPKYENKIQKQRTRHSPNDNLDLPITNRQRNKNFISNTVNSANTLQTVQSSSSPQLFDINHYIPDSKIMRELRRNNTLFSKRKVSNIKQEIAESQPRHSFSSRFNSADEQLPLPTEKTLQKPVILIIEQTLKGNHDNKSQAIRKNHFPKPNKQEETTINNLEKLSTTTQRIVSSFRRVRPIPIIRTSTSISTSDITESSIRKLNRPRLMQNTKPHSKSSDPIDQKEHIINRSNINKTIRNLSTPRPKLVVDPIALRHKARAEAQAEAMEKVKEKLELNTEKQDIQDKLSNIEKELRIIEENPSNNRHYEKKEHRHSTSEVIHTKLYSPNNEHSEDDFENHPEDNDDDDDEHDETLSKDYSEQVEIIGDLEQVRKGPKHGGNYRHINDQTSDDTNHDDRRNKHIEHDEIEGDSDDEESDIKYTTSYSNDFAESKIKSENKNPEDSILDELTIHFYSDPLLPRKINNLKHDVIEEPVISPSTVIKLSKEQNKPPAYWSKIIKDPGMRHYFYVRQ